MPDVSLARDMQGGRENQEKRNENRERAGISAGSLSLDGNAYQHHNNRIVRKVAGKKHFPTQKMEETCMKKKLLAVGIMVLVTGIIVAVRRKKKYAKAV